MGELQHGLYNDECEGLTPEEINAFYGFSGSEESQDSDEDSNGSDEQVDHSSDNYEGSEADMELDKEGFRGILNPDGFDMKVRLFITSSTWIDFWLKEIDNNIRHEAVPIPSAHYPFNDEELSLFEQGLKLLMDSSDLPPGYGVTLAELCGDGFDEQEDINIGLQKKGGPNWPTKMHLEASNGNVGTGTFCNE